MKIERKIECIIRNRNLQAFFRVKWLNYGDIHVCIQHGTNPV